MTGLGYRFPEPYVKEEVICNSWAGGRKLRRGNGFVYAWFREINEATYKYKIFLKKYRFIRREFLRSKAREEIALVKYHKSREVHEKTTNEHANFKFNQLSQGRIQETVSF